VLLALNLDVLYSKSIFLLVRPSRVLFVVVNLVNAYSSAVSARRVMMWKGVFDILRFFRLLLDDVDLTADEFVSDMCSRDAEFGKREVVIHKVHTNPTVVHIPLLVRVRLHGLRDVLTWLHERLFVEAELCIRLLRLIMLRELMLLFLRLTAVDRHVES